MDLPFSVAEFASVESNPTNAKLEAQPVEPLDTKYKKYGARLLYVKEVLSRSECEFLIQKFKCDGHAETLESSLQARGRTQFESHAFAKILQTKLSNILTSFIPDIILDEEGRPSCDATALNANLDDGNQSVPTMAPRTIWVNQTHKRVKGVWQKSHLNPHLRFCSYQQGGYFRAHCDGQVFKDEEEMSIYTCMLYLDDDFVGGSTRFLNPDLQVGDVFRGEVERQHILAEISPEVGSCLLFFQPGLLHEGEAIQKGQKHILRSEVMFKRKPGTGEKQTDQQREAISFLNQAQEAEADKKFELAMRLYKKAFRLDPSLEDRV